MAKTEIVIKPLYGLDTTAGWALTTPTVNQTNNIGKAGITTTYGGLIFDLPDLRYAIISKIALRIRLESQDTLIGSGRLYTGAYVFNSIADATLSFDYNVTGVTWRSENLEFDATKDTKLYKEYPRKLAYSLSFLADSQQAGYTGYVRANYSLCYLAVTYEPYIILPPNTLSPTGVSRNPKSTIACSWQYVKSSYTQDKQIASELRYRINGGSWTQVTLNNILNQYTFSPSRFADGNRIDWQTRTISDVSAVSDEPTVRLTSDWSEIATFNIGITPPLAPTLDYPVDIPVNVSNGVLLQWAYNSQYDTTPSRFDVEYRIGNETTKAITTTGQVNTMIPPGEFGTEQNAVIWRVRAYGEYGDVGPWSGYATFYTVGLPARPVIVEVTNSNLPTVYFSASNLMSWELEILQNDQPVYTTGNMPFLNNLTYTLTDFISNGNYVAQLRVTNEYGIKSNWGTLAFTISVEPPKAVELDIAYNTKFFIRLLLGKNPEGTVYIYRAEFHEDKFIRIIKAGGDIYDDYAACPERRYKYFARTVNEFGSYADSDIKSGDIKFLETTLAECDTPEDMLELLVNLENRPQKNAALSYEKAIVPVVGRRFPLFENGKSRRQEITYVFYCDFNAVKRLKEFAGSGKTLVLRDKRHGTVYGTLGDTLNVTPETRNGFIVSFAFTQTDYNVEVPLG